MEGLLCYSPALLSKGTQLRMSCPYTSPQNGKAKHIVRSINNVIYMFLIQAPLPERYWVEGLHTVMYLLNRLSMKMISVAYPHVTLFGSAPSYEYIHIFGCACYPNIVATMPHKLAPQSTRCVFLPGLSPKRLSCPYHYRCLRSFQVFLRAPPRRPLHPIALKLAVQPAIRAVRLPPI
jgi:hypothetical protein